MATGFIHKSSIVDNTKIWHFSYVVTDTVIGQNCVVSSKVTIGNRIEVEDDVSLDLSMVFTNGINPRVFIQRKEEFKKTLLKKDYFIGEYVLIGSRAVINKDV